MYRYDDFIFTTPFSFIYDLFLSKITDDMYMELTESETYALLQELLISAIPKFEFPRVNITDYIVEETLESEYCGVSSDNKKVPITLYYGGHFDADLSDEEMNILATYMIVEWLGQQLATVELVRMKYTGSDFKFTSQANHIQKLLALKKDYEREGFHLQRLYKRRVVDAAGKTRSTMSMLIDPNNYPVDVNNNPNHTRQHNHARAVALQEIADLFRQRIPHKPIPVPDKRPPKVTEDEVASLFDKKPMPPEQSSPPSKPKPKLQPAPAPAPKPNKVHVNDIAALFGKVDPFAPKDPPHCPKENHHDDHI